LSASLTQARLPPLTRKGDAQTPSRADVASAASDSHDTIHSPCGSVTFIASSSETSGERTLTTATTAAWPRTEIAPMTSTTTLCLLDRRRDEAECVTLGTTS
jgi:hypothetical protein